MPDTPDLVTLEEIKIELPIAQLGTRGLAQIVDFVIIILALIFLVSLVGLFSILGKVAATTIFLSALIAMFLLYWGYFVFFEMISNGQSPGKRLLGLRVVTSRGERISFLASLTRNFIRSIDFLPIFYGVGILTILLSNRAQRLGDMAAGTLVIREKKSREGEETWAPLRRYPSSFTPEEVKMAETFLERIFYVIQERKSPLIDLFYQFLEKKHPDLLLGREVPEDLDGRIRTIYELFPPVGEEND